MKLQTLIGSIWNNTLTRVVASAMCALVVATAFAADEPSSKINGFESPAARGASNDGSPVGPPQKVIICHKGKTISVSQAAVPVHLAHGDTLGPCPGETVMCVKHQPYEAHTFTQIVNNNDVPAYLAQGATVGPCSGEVWMCNNNGNPETVLAHQVANRQARGWTVGICPGQSLICYKGKTFRIKNDKLADYLLKGACVGYCLGGPGPVVSGNGCGSTDEPVLAPAP